MPISTPLTNEPYWDDYSPSKDYYKILFQPGVTVQARELNQLQTMFQHQLEKFGDNTFKSGTIISGCNQRFHKTYPYAKIKDLDFEGNKVNVFDFVNYSALNETTGMRGWIVNQLDGFESSAPDLKTLYVIYQNHGFNNITTSFSPADTLKIYDPTLNPVESVKIVNGGVGFTNADSCIAVSALICSANAGSFTPGDYLVNGTGSCNVQIIGVDTATLASSNLAIIRVAPRLADLSNGQVNATAWTFDINQPITNPAQTLVGTVNNIVGSGFSAKTITNGVGAVTNILILSKGVQYTTPPYITIRSLNNTVGLSSLNLNCRTFKTKVSIASGADAVGNGYAYELSSGVIYQKGYFLESGPQFVIVSKYDQKPDNVAVVFTTSEYIIDSNIDTSLLDNAGGQKNYQAPGANRLKLIPNLQMVNLSSTNTVSDIADLLVICSWKNGNAYYQNATTDYNVIDDQLATRTKETNGNFVIDPFLITSKSPTNPDFEGQIFNTVIDPGTAFISGYRVSTQGNYNIDVMKGFDSAVVNTSIVSLTYGNYVYVNNLGGVFQFNTGDSVDLYSANTGFLSNSVSIINNTLTPSGSKIGTASVRSLVYDGGVQGTSESIYRLYLFNINMSAGKNINSVKSIYYNGTNKGIADVVLTNKTVIQEPQSDQMIFSSSVDSLKNANNVIYTYRTLDQTVTVANTGVSIKSIASDPTEFFPYSGTLSAAEMQDFYIVPISGDLIANTASAGTVNAILNNANVATTQSLVTDFIPGDYAYIYSNATAQFVSKVVGCNTTVLNLASAINFTTNAVSTVFKIYPRSVPVPFGRRAGLTASIDGSSQILTLGFGNTFSFSGTKTIGVGCNIQRYYPNAVSKTAVRNRFIKINCGTNDQGAAGPWCIGVPDAFRLRSVYVGDASVDTTGTNYASNFYLDHNQNANFYDLGWLYLKPKTRLGITAGNYLLVEFDYFTHSGVGFYDTTSYLGSDSPTILLNDSLPLANLQSQVNSFEVPEVFTDSGKEIDLLNSFDFRPYAANTVAPSTTAGGAPVNPSSTVAFSTTGEKKIPAPDSEFSATIEYYLGRTDGVFVNKAGAFSILKGVPNANKLKRIAPQTPTNSIRISDISVPPYPNLPANYSTVLAEVLDTKISNRRYLTTRQKNQTISSSNSTKVAFNQPKNYTMYDIGNLERRLSDMEYYVGLTALESNTASMFLPSSNDPTTNRFQYGLFVDDFTSSTFSDISNPEYEALWEGGDIVPTKMKWDVSSSYKGGPAYVEWRIVNQGVATYNDVDPLAGKPTCAINLANTVAYTQVFRNTGDMQNPDSLQDIIQVQFADAATLYGLASTASGAGQTTNVGVTQSQQTTSTACTYSTTVTTATPTTVVSTVVSDAFTYSPAAAGATSTANTAWAGTGMTSLQAVDPAVIAAMTPEELSNYYHSTVASGVVPVYGYSISGANTASNISATGQSGAQYAASMSNQGVYTSLDATFQAALIQSNLPTAAASGTSTTVGPASTSTTTGAASVNSTTYAPIASVYSGGSSTSMIGVPTSGGYQTFVSTTFKPPIVLYFYNYDESVKFQIYQGSTLVATSASATVLTAQEKTLLTGSGSKQWFNDYPQYFMKDFSDTGNGFVNYAGKVSFNYDPNKGNVFSIVTQMSTNSHRWRYVLAYPINGRAVGCVPPTQILQSNYQSGTNVSTNSSTAVSTATHTQVANTTATHVGNTVVGNATSNTFVSTVNINTQCLNGVAVGAGQVTITANVTNLAATTTTYVDTTTTVTNITDTTLTTTNTTTTTNWWTLTAPAIPTPTTSVVPFNISQDWATPV